jgi:hypothetical protein
MNKREKAIVSAYTGYLCGQFSIMHEYIEGLMGRPVYTHELGDKKTMAQIHELAKPDFVALSENEK